MYATPRSNLTGLMGEVSGMNVKGRNRYGELAGKSTERDR